MKQDSTFKTLFIAAILCIVCSVLVSTAAVKLKPLQVENQKLDIKKNLLIASGLIANGDVTREEIYDKYQQIEALIVDIETGSRVDGVDIESFDMKKAAKKSGENYMIPADKNIAKINMRSKLAKIYLVKQMGTIVSIILPVNGKGLWSTLYGFLVLDIDTTTIKGLTFYKHGETPGLGGEVDNPNWKKLWVGKKVFKEGDTSYVPEIKVVKGIGKGPYQIDGLSGATITSNGVSGLIKYWLGDNAFGPTLEKFRTRGAL